MLGLPKPRRLDEPIAVSLEGLVAADHVDRHLDATRDAGFVRERVKECAADRDREEQHRSVSQKKAAC